MGNHSRWPSLLATHIVYGSCKPWAETDHHGGREERAAKEPRIWQRHCRQCSMRVQCMWSNMSISSRPLQPPTYSSNINLFILIIIIILDDSDHHTRSRGIARERERETVTIVLLIAYWANLILTNPQCDFWFLAIKKPWGWTPGYCASIRKHGLCHAGFLLPHHGDNPYGHAVTRIYPLSYVIHYLN